MNDFAILCILCGAGVAWGATATYLIRVRDNALQAEVSLRSRYSGLDHVAEIAVAGFAGFLCGILAYSAGANPPLIVFAASAGSFLNRSAFALLAKYVPIYVDRYMHRNGMDVGGDTIRLDFFVKTALLNRLNGDWPQLSDYFDVPASTRAQWDKGREPYSLILWIANRDRMTELPDGLRAIERRDLAELLQNAKKFE